MRNYNKPIDFEDEELDLMSVKQWSEVKNVCYRNDDGNGYWCKGGLESNDEVFSTEQLDATHVIWYSK